MFETAKIAFDLFKDVTDRGGVPYINHLAFVATSVRSNGVDFVKCALLHDAIEDIDYVDAEWLKEKGFSDVVVEAVVAITKVEGEEYSDYLKRVKENKIARVVKIEDMKHNSDLTRLKEVTEKDLLRVEKYKKAIAELGGT